MSDPRTANDIIKMAINTASHYRLSDPHDREVVSRFIARCLRIFKAEGTIGSEEAYRLLQKVDLGVFRDMEAEQVLGVPEDELKETYYVAEH